MAKQEVYKYPSRFGSHKSMVVTESPTEEESGKVICEDEFGRYETQVNRLDNGCADPNRFASSRLGKLYEKTVDKK